MSYRLSTDHHERMGGCGGGCRSYRSTSDWMRVAETRWRKPDEEIDNSSWPERSSTAYRMRQQQRDGEKKTSDQRTNKDADSSNPLIKEVDRYQMGWLGQRLADDEKRQGEISERRRREDDESHEEFLGRQWEDEATLEQIEREEREKLAKESNPYNASYRKYLLSQLSDPARRLSLFSPRRGVYGSGEHTNCNPYYCGWACPLSTRFEDEKRSGDINPYEATETRIRAGDTPYPGRYGSSPCRYPGSSRELESPTGPPRRSPVASRGTDGCDTHDVNNGTTTPPVVEETSSDFPTVRAPEEQTTRGRDRNPIASKIPDDDVSDLYSSLMDAYVALSPAQPTSPGYERSGSPPTELSSDRSALLEPKEQSDIPSTRLSSEQPVLPGFGERSGSTSTEPSFEPLPGSEERSGRLSTEEAPNPHNARLGLLSTFKGRKRERTPPPPPGNESPGQTDEDRNISSPSLPFEPTRQPKRRRKMI